MTHLDPDRDLLPFLFDELEDDSRARVAAHLRECPSCARETAALRALANALPRALAPTPDAMASARARLERSLAPQRPTPKIRSRDRFVLTSATLAAAAILILLLRPHVDLAPPALPASLQALDRQAISRFILDRLPRLPLVKERTGA